jgi:DnaJ-domain-containing protein 1
MLRVGGKRVSELSDQELESELLRRRRVRGVPADLSPRAEGPKPADVPSATTASRLAAAVRRSNLAQWYANLELRAGAPIEEVEAAYRRLLERYSPERHADDPERHRDAKRLVQGLTDAYRGLLEHLREKS